MSGVKVCLLESVYGQNRWAVDFIEATGLCGLEWDEVQIGLIDFYSQTVMFTKSSR